MMAPRGFDRYMVVVGMGGDPLLARLTDSERCAYVLGILSIAAQSPIPGYLLIVRDVEADERDVSFVAGVSKRQARGALAKLKEQGALVRDEDVGSWYVRTWREHDPRARVRRRVLDPALRAQVIERDGYRCQLCGSPIAPDDTWHVDHVISVARGGSDALSNLQATHALCNQRKGAG